MEEKSKKGDDGGKKKKKSFEKPGCSKAPHMLGRERTTEDGGEKDQKGKRRTSE